MPPLLPAYAAAGGGVRDHASFPASFRLAGCSFFSDAAGLLSALAALDELPLCDVLLLTEEAALLLVLPEPLVGLLESEEELLVEADALPAEDAELSALLEDAELASVLPEEESSLDSVLLSALPEMLPESVLSALLDAEELAELLVLEELLPGLLLAEELSELLVELLSVLPLADEDALLEEAEDALDDEPEDALSELDELLLSESDSLSALEELLADTIPLTVTSSVLLVTVQSL